MAFSALVAPATAQVSSVFPLDHFWTRTFDAPFAAAPAVDAGRVFVALRTGRVVALDPRTNAEVWSVELTAHGAPLAADGRVFVPAADAIHALDAATGARLWPGPLPAGALAVPLVHRGGWLIVALADGGLQGVRATDGVVVWARTETSALASPPAIDGNLLVAALADGRILAMDVTTGKERWQRTLGRPAGSLLVSGDRIFAGTADGIFWSLEASDGDSDWPPWEIGSRLIGSAAADEERVYAVFLDNVVRAFDRDSGNLQWPHAVASRALGGPQLVDGLLVITRGDIGSPGLTYISAETGTAAGRTPALRPIGETTRTQFPAVITSGSTPLAVIATATLSGEWQVHAYRQTFILPAPGLMVWGRRYEVRRRLDIRTGPMSWGERVPFPGPSPVRVASHLRGFDLRMATKTRDE